MKKKKIILIIVLILLILLGVLGYMYYATDFLKSDEQLFWKYAVKNSEIAQLFNNDEIINIKNKKVNNSYKIDSSLNIHTKNNVYMVSANTNAKNSSDIFTKIGLKKDNTDIIDCNFIKKNNIVGFKMDELANGYITVKNGNLKSLLQNMGIDNTTNFPDSINFETYSDVLELSQDDVNYITDKYTKLIISDTNKKTIAKVGAAGIKINDKIHTTTSYKIELSENEAKKILVDVFNELSKDSRALNIISTKMKMLNLSDEYSQINYISSKFSNIANNINSLDTSDDELLEIIVYAEKNELVQTSIKIKQEKLIKIVNDKENNKINIKQEILKENLKDKFILSISDVLNKILSQIEEIEISNETKNENNIITNIDVLCKNNITLTYNSNLQVTENIEESNDYDNSKKLVLNDLSKEQLKNLYNILSKNILSIYQDKKAIILNKEQNSIAENNNEVQ